MIAQRVGVAAMRRGMAQPSVFQTLPKVAMTAGMSTTPRRPASMDKLSVDAGNQILVNQRLKRPVSPHLEIYKIEQTWFGCSAWNRITGITLSGALYGYMASYLVAPLFGLHLESASVASFFGDLPAAAQGAFKFALGFPFVFHCVNGTKHLFYDLGWGFEKKMVLKSEKIVWATTILGGLLVAFAL